MIKLKISCIRIFFFELLERSKERQREKERKETRRRKISIMIDLNWSLIGERLGHQPPADPSEMLCFEAYRACFFAICPRDINLP